MLDVKVHCWEGKESPELCECEIKETVESCEECGFCGLKMQKGGLEMKVDRAIEILDPEHRENYDGLDEVNEACRMGMEALERTRWIPCSERLPEEGQYVLCWYQYFRYGKYNRLWQTYGIGFQYNGNWGGEVSTGRDTKVLFWMPMPEPPEEVLPC